MSEPISRRRRRRRGDNSEINSFLTTPTKPLSPPTTSEVKSDDSSSNIPQETVDSGTTSHQATIDRIRSEIQEDEYHCLFDEPDYSNDSHDWANNHESVSSDYCHFLGLYE